MPIPFVTYIPLLLKLVTHMCSVITKHSQKIIAVGIEVWPGHTADIEDAFAKIQSACDIIAALEHALRIFEA